MDAARGIAFLHGCPEAARPKLWRTLLGPGAQEDAAALQERRSAYRELRSRMVADMPHVQERSEDKSEGSSSSTATAKVFRSEVEADARAVWRGEAFVERQEVVEAVTSVVLTHAWRASRYVTGSCDLAALVLFALGGGSFSSLEPEAEADAFWCFSQLMAEVQDSLAGEGLATQARRCHELLRAFDPPLADLLADAGLGALPAMRLGAVLLTRSGLSLAQCARIWDSLLADPRRFEFCDYVVVALLLLNRGELLQRADVGGIAETIIAAPQSAKLETLLRIAYAVCAFERRCVQKTGVWLETGLFVPFECSPCCPGVEVTSTNTALVLDWQGHLISQLAIDLMCFASALKPMRLSSQVEQLTRATTA
ncbi:unnamed protein product [Polarella glacialis]|uniref:Rab-GAP TBC domain-containing protein n=1 Tax=Polarella glacialis TaxID=89957 RepID=A0A813I2L9_POLGL|nr:unnamed protein product [Polarella glacialis]